MKAIRAKLEAERDAHEATKKQLQDALDALGAIQDLMQGQDHVSVESLDNALTEHLTPTFEDAVVTKPGESLIDKVREARGTPTCPLCEQPAINGHYDDCPGYGVVTPD